MTLASPLMRFALGRYPGPGRGLNESTGFLGALWDSRPVSGAQGAMDTNGTDSAPAYVPPYMLSLSPS